MQANQTVLANILHSYKVHNLVLYKHGDLVAANDEERLHSQSVEAKILDEQHDLLRQAEHIKPETDREILLLLKLWAMENITPKSVSDLTTSDKIISNILACISTR